MSLWTPAAFYAERGLANVSETVLQAALSEADAAVQRRITSTAYLDACATTPTDPLAATLIKKAIADLATIYLRQRTVIPPAATGYSESYSGVASYSLTSSGDAAAASVLTEATVLATLAAYARPLNFMAGRGWGSGRFEPRIAPEDK